MRAIVDFMYKGKCLLLKDRFLFEFKLRKHTQNTPIFIHFLLLSLNFPKKAR